MKWKSVVSLLLVWLSVANASAQTDGTAQRPQTTNWETQRSQLLTAQQNVKRETAREETRAIQNANLLLFEEYAATVDAAYAEHQTQMAESLLKDWRDALTEAENVLNENQRLYSRARYESSAGNYWENTGLRLYFTDGDFFRSPGFLEKARLGHAYAAELMQAVKLPDDTPAEGRATLHDSVKLQLSETDRVAGMSQLIQGEMWLQAGQTHRAIEMLTQAVNLLQSGQQQWLDSLAAHTSLGETRRHVDYIGFAQALLHEARSEQAKVQGNLAAAAEEQDLRSKVLESTRSMHLRADTELNTWFANRLNRDIHLAKLHRDYLLAELGKMPQNQWLGALLFFVLAIGSVIGVIVLTAKYQLSDNKIVMGMLLLFIMAVAGIGARQVKWQDAATWFSQSTVSTLEKAATEKKPE